MKRFIEKRLTPWPARKAGRRGRLSRLSAVSVLLVCTETPASRRARSPAILRSQEPGAPQSASWTAASGLSRLSCALSMPAAFSERARSGLARLPLVMRLTRSPRPTA